MLDYLGQELRIGDYILFNLFYENGAYEKMSQVTDIREDKSRPRIQIEYDKISYYIRPDVVQKVTEAEALLWKLEH